MKEEDCSMKIGPEERDFLTRIRDGNSLRIADRVEDRVRQRCRKFGLAFYGGSPCRWNLTPADRAALEQG